MVMKHENVGDGWKGEKAGSWVAGTGIIKAGERSW